MRFHRLCWRCTRHHQLSVLSHPITYSQCATDPLTISLVPLRDLTEEGEFNKPIFSHNRSRFNGR